MKCKICNIKKPENKFDYVICNNKKYYRKICSKCRSKINEKSKRLRLTDRYIKVLCYNQNLLFTNELIELKRQLIILKRTIKKLSN